MFILHTYELLLLLYSSVGIVRLFLDTYPFNSYLEITIVASTKLKAEATIYKHGNRFFRNEFSIHF